MRTTIALESATRDRLLALKRAWRLASLDDTLRRLLDGPALGARALYERNRNAVDETLRRHRIRRLIAFGSRARGDARPDSDLDLAGAVPKQADLFDLEHARADLEKAFGVPVNFVALDALPPRLKASIDREGVSLAA